MHWWMAPIAFAVAVCANGSGIEGAALYAPILRVVVPAFHVAPMNVAAAIYGGLAIQTVGFASGTVGHARLGHIDRAWLRRWWPLCVLSAVVGAVASLRAAGGALDALAAAAVAVAALRIAGLPLGRGWRPGAQIAAGGVLTGLVGTGLGPALTATLLEKGEPPPRASGTTVPLVLAAVVAAGLVRAVGFGGPLALRWDLVVPGWLGVVVGGQVAAPLLRRLPARSARVAMVAVFGIASALMAFDGLRRL